MHVVIVSKNIGMMRGGGATRTLRFSEGLAARGVRVTLVLCRPLFGALRHRVTGPFEVVTVRSPYLRDLSYRLPRGRGLVPLLDDRLFQSAVLRLVGTEIAVPDVFLTFGNFPLAAALRSRFARPSVVASAGGLPGTRVAGAVRRVDAIVGDGSEIDAFSEAFGVCPIEVRKGVDTERFRPASSPGAEAGPLRLLFVGRLVPVKNVPMALRVIAELASRGVDATLTLAAAGSLAGPLRREASRLGISHRTRFLGHVDEAELPGVYRDADVFVLTSTFDNFPNAVLEAMASALPVVATDVGGISGQIRHGENGYLVPSGDEGAMADALTVLAAQPARRREMGARNRRVAEREYRWEDAIGALQAVLDRVVTKNPPVAISSGGPKERSVA